MSKLLITIRSKYPEMSKTERRIADYVFEHAGNLTLSTITEFSKETNASEATIIRFVKRIGCEGYPEFKIRIAKEEVHHIVNESIADNDDFLTMYSKISDDVYSSFIKTRDDLTNEVLEETYNSIVNAKKIVLMGVGNSYAMSLDFYHKLLRLGFNVQITFDSHFELISACQSDKDTLVIAITHSGYTKDVYDAVSAAKDKGAKIISITSNPKSPIAQCSDLVIRTNSDETNYRVLGLSSRYSELLVFDTIYSYAVLHLEHAKEIVEDIEERISIKRINKKK